MADRRRGQLVARERKGGMRPRKVLNAELKAAVWRKSLGRCWYCGVPCNPFSNLHIDHVIPRSRGGSDDYDNLVVACVICNQEKRDLPLPEFRRKRFGGQWPFAFWNETEEGRAFLYGRRDAIVTMMGVRVA